MSNVREAVGLFLSLPITTQSAIMTEFGYPTCTGHYGYVECFTGLRKEGRADEFCDYMIEKYGK